MPGSVSMRLVGHLEAAAVAVQHGREAAADAAVVELHVLVGSEGGEDRPGAAAV